MLMGNDAYRWAKNKVGNIIFTRSPLKVGKGSLKGIPQWIHVESETLHFLVMFWLLVNYQFLKEVNCIYSEFVQCGCETLMYRGENCVFLIVGKQFVMLFDFLMDSIAYPLPKCLTKELAKQNYTWFLG